MNNETNGTKAKTDVIAEFLDTNPRVGMAMEMTIEEWETRQEPVITPFEVTDKLEWPELFSKMKDVDQWILDVDQLMYMNPMSHKTNIEANIQMDRIMEEMKVLAKELGVVFTLEGRFVHADIESYGLRDKFESLTWQEDSKTVALINKLKGKHRQPGGEFDYPVHCGRWGSKTETSPCDDLLIVGHGDQIQPYPGKLSDDTKKIGLFGGYGKRSVDMVDALLANVVEAYRAMPAQSPRPLEKESWKQTKIRRGKGHNKFKRRK